MAATATGGAAPPASVSDTESDTEPEPRPPTRRGRREGPPLRVRLRRDKTLILMALPAVLLVLVFSYGPMFGSVMAFQYYDVATGFTHSPWAGLYQFQHLVNDPLFWHALENTLAISAFQLILFFPIPIALALLLNSVLSARIRSAVQTIVYLPHFFSWVLVVTVFQEMFGGAGVFATFLRNHGVARPFDVMTDPNPTVFKMLVTSQAVWKEAGWGIIVFLAAIAAIDPALYEAAAADGAGKWRRTWHITLPGMRGVIVLLLVLRLGNALSVGFEQLLLQRDAVGRDAAEVLDTFSYYYGVGTGDLSYGAAAGLFKGVLSLVLILAANKLAHVFGEDGMYRR